MDLIWIPISIFAALMQSVRTAAQKTLNQTMSTMGTTYVRSLVGFPFLIAFLWGVVSIEGGGAPRWHSGFVAYCFVGGLCQILATALLIKLFTLKSFAVSTMLIKSDVLMTAVIGSIWFSEVVSTVGWVALVVVLSGVGLLSVGKLSQSKREETSATLLEALSSAATRVAVSCALMFTFSYLAIREATLILEPGTFLWRGGWTVVTTTALQVLGLGAWLAVKERQVFTQLWPNRRIIGFIGFTSAMGSIGWFTAFALENASYVRAVAQVEVIFTLVISWAYFREKINRLEYVGIAVTVLGILLFRLVD